MSSPGPAELEREARRRIARINPTVVMGWFTEGAAAEIVRCVRSMWGAPRDVVIDAVCAALRLSDAAHQLPQVEFLLRVLVREKILGWVRSPETRELIDRECAEALGADPLRWSVAQVVLRPGMDVAEHYSEWDWIAAQRYRPARRGKRKRPPIDGWTT